jgi:hypothetical protein
VYPSEILMRLTALFDYGTLPKSQICDFSKSFIEGGTEV